MDKHYKAIDSALLALWRDLETKAINATLKLSTNNPDIECMFICSMGDWFWLVGTNSDIKPPANKAIEKAFTEYGYNALAESVKVICVNGEMISRARAW